MFTEQVGLLEEIKTIDQVVEVLRFMLGNCQANLRHNGTLLMDSSRPLGATDAVLTVKNSPHAPETLETESPSNGYAADFWGKVRFRGVAQFDQAIMGDGGVFQPLMGVLWMGAIADIPAGWALMDGTANSVGNGGSGIDMRGMVPYGYSGAGDFATIGGTIAVALATSFSGSGNVTTSTDPGHNHEITGTEISGAISISAHAAEPGSEYTNYCIFGVADGVSDPVFDGTTAPDSDYTNDEGTPGRVTVQGHRHTITHTAIADSLTSHTISTTGSNAETTSGGSHSHTASISTIAGGLSIGTPTTVRSPGKVVAFIEKLAT